MGAVTVGIAGIVVVPIKIPPVDVIDIAVAVVIDAVSGNLAGVGPDIGGQIRMIDVHTGIDDGHHDIAAAGGHTPGFKRIDVGIIGAVGPVHILTGVMQPPQAAKIRVIRGANVGINNIIGFGIFDIRVLQVKLQGFFDVNAFGKLYLLVAVDGKGSAGGDVKPLFIGRCGLSANLRSKFYKEFTGNIGRSLRIALRNVRCRGSHSRCGCQEAKYGNHPARSVAAVRACLSFNPGDLP